MNEQINNGGQGQQAARVDDMDAAADRLGDYLVRELSVYLTHKSLRAALEAALPAQPLIHESGAISSESGQPAERQGDRPAGMNDILWANRGGVPAHPAAPVGVPNIDALVDRFLGWPLPASVCADPCATMPNYQFPRSGTCLLDAVEAKAMFEYVLAAAPDAPVGVPDGMVPADAMRNLYRAYVRTLEAGLDRITSLGGDCDSVEHMEHTDPALIVARRILAAAPSAREVQA